VLVKKLREANHIQEIGPYFVGDFIDIEDDADQLLRDGYWKNEEAMSNELGSAAWLFFGGSHDSKILGLRTYQRDLYLELSDFQTAQLAYALREHKRVEISDSRIKFPVTIVFSGVSHYSLNTINRQGRIKRRSSKFSRHLTEYLYESFSSFEKGRIELCLNLWSKDQHCGHSRWLSLIECEGIAIHQDFRSKWVTLFGDESSALFDQYMQNRFDGKSFSAYHVCEEFVVSSFA
jgi:hypothetical protein